MDWSVFWPAFGAVLTISLMAATARAVIAEVMRKGLLRWLVTVGWCVVVATITALLAAKS